MSVHCVLEAEATVGESPRWSAEEQRLYFIDIQRREIHRFDPIARSDETFVLPEIVTSIALRRAGGVVLTLKKQFALFDPATDALTRLEAVEQGLADNRFNDGLCDPAGRFWAGTMDAKSWSRPSGSLYRLDADGTSSLVRSHIVCSNGLGWSPDGRTLYHTESFRYAIFAYDFDVATGAISRRRPYVEMDRDEGGFPDGLTVDAEGHVWSNVVGLGQIRRYDPSGRLERVVSLPVPRATDCVFGGPSLDTLYVTTARETMSPEALAAAPLSGCLFAVECDVRGLPSTRFAG